MSTEKVTITLDRALFAEADAAARELKESRSALFSDAIREYLERRRNRKLFQQFNKVYADGMDAEERHVLASMDEATAEILGRDPW